MADVYPIAIDGANYEVTVSAGVSPLSSTIQANAVNASTEANGTFATTGKYTFPQDLDIDRNLDVVGSTTMGGSLVLDDTLLVAGTVDADGDLNVALDLTVSGDADVLGKIDVGDNIIIDGAASIEHGVGSPESAVTANPGSIYLNESGGTGTTVYLKESGVGNTGWEPATSATLIRKQSWGMPTAVGTLSPDTYYVGGSYMFASTDNDFNPAATYGTALGSYAAHIFFVAAAGATDTEITVTGTTITDAGVRTASDTEVVQINNASADTYYETNKKFLGQVSIEKTAGTDRLLNYGWCKYWDNQNQDFTIKGGEATWYANNAGAFDVQLIHHKATGWTYNAGAAATPPDPLFNMATLHGPELNTVANEYGAVKIIDPGTFVEGSANEGILGAIVTSVNNQIHFGQMTLSFNEE